MVVGEEIQLDLEGVTVNDVIWTTSNPNVATVTQAGLVTAAAAGSSTVTATLKSDTRTSASITITILAPPQSGDVVITPATATLQVDQDATFTVSMTNVDAPTFTWTTSCGTINATGLSATYTAPTETGTCNLTVKHDQSEHEGNATVTITPGPADLTTSTVSVTSTQLTADGTSTATITVTLKDQHGNPLTTNGGTITFDTATLVGTIGAVTDNQDGTYTATYTAGTTHGTETIKAKLDDQPLATTSVTLIVFSMIHAGKWHSLALDTNGNAWAWGRDPYGQLGDGGTNTDKATPVPVDMPPDVSFTDVHAGGSHSLALDTNGNAWAWGDDGYGQLGDGGDNTDKATPVQVTMPTDVSFTDVHAGGSHSLALDTNGNAWAWGDDGYGQLGDGGTNTDKATPVEVSMPDDVTFETIHAGYPNSLALDTTGNAWAWGDDGYGQLGDGGDNTDKATPVEVSMPDDVTFETIHAGTYYSLALDTNGNVWAWGRDRYGQLGDGGTNTNQATPVPVDMP